MERRLKNNIIIIFNKLGIENFKVQIVREWGRLLVKFDPILVEKNPSIINKAIFILTKYIFGITSISPVIRTTSNIEDIKRVSFELASNNLVENSTFAVRARRTGKHDYSSLDLERLVGEVIYESLSKVRNLKVNLKNPQYTLNIEVRDDIAFVFDEKIEAFGGLPQGTQGSLTSILRGSMEDAIAAFLMSKRGSLITPIIFRKQIDKYISNENALNEHMRVIDHFLPFKKRNYYEVDFDKILNAIGYKNLQCSTCDKVCIGIAEKIAKQNNSMGITLGNKNKSILTRNPERNFGLELIPIYYPLIALDYTKLEHPFVSFKKKCFCLAECPGYKNQKKKNIKPPSQKELEKIVANANFEKIVQN